MIANKNFSIIVKDSFAFEINGQGDLRLAAGGPVLSNLYGMVKDFQRLQEESVSTALGIGRRFVFTGQRGDIAIRLVVDSYEHLGDSIVMQWSFENIGNS